MFRFLLITGLLFFIGYSVFSFLIRHFGNNSTKAHNKGQQTNSTEADSKKHFSKKIGEYVDYEEIENKD